MPRVIIFQLQTDLLFVVLTLIRKSDESCAFLVYTLKPSGKYVYQENTSGIFHGIQRESVA